MTAVHLTVPAANRSGVFTSAHRLSLPDGWTAEVWALVNAVRFETWTPEHDLLASAPADGTVTLLTPKTGDPAAPPAALSYARAGPLPAGRGRPPGRASRTGCAGRRQSG